MNLNFLCCIGAEQKHDQSGLLKMNQVYFYRAYADETMSEILEDNFFNHSESHLKENDIVLAYSPNEQDLPKTCWLRIVIPHAGLVKTEKIDDSEIIETLRADLGDLGEQVAEIEAKIPGSASVINQLATQNDITNKITNCITEIPQDIKLELNNGTLILKAGSKVYVPNGSGVYQTQDIASNLSVSAIANRTTMILWRNGGLQRIDVDSCYSGATAPTPSLANAIWYDTANNVIKYTDNSGNTWIENNNISLPVCIAIETTAGFTEIKQIFNGFGYIGSTAFALPGVKALAPSGRNADGTLKSQAFIISSVLTTTDVSAATGELEFYFNNNGIYRANLGFFIYDFSENRILNSSGVSQYVVTLDVSAYRRNGRVIRFYPKKAFAALDYSDTDFIAHQAMPSGQFVGLTLGVSGTEYVAPADGYFIVIKEATSANQALDIINMSNSVGSRSSSVSSIDVCRGFVPVSKGETVRISYTVAGNTGAFRFVYLNGTK